MPSVLSTLFTRRLAPLWTNVESRLLPSLALEGVPPVSQQVHTPSQQDLFHESIWQFAVPKKKVTRHKKRLKTTVQKRIPLRKDIIIDPRTGEVTLKHKLPFNWKDYLPKEDGQ